MGSAAARNQPDGDLSLWNRVLQKQQHFQHVWQANALGCKLSYHSLITVPYADDDVVYDVNVFMMVFRTFQQGQDQNYR